MNAGRDVDARDRAEALGILFRGIAHENANALNTIAMHAQLGTVSVEEAPASLKTIAASARAGGAFLKGLSAFLTASDLLPQTESSMVECLVLARKLLGSHARRTGTALAVEYADSPPLPLNPIGAAVSVALLIHAVCDGGPERADLSGELQSDGYLVTMTVDPPCAWYAVEDGCADLALRFAAGLACDHGGQFEYDQTQWRLLLPLATTARGQSASSSS